MADLSTAFIPMIDLDSTNTPNACGMERKIQIFKSFAEADEADKKYYHSLTPAQRIQISLMLRDRYRPYGDERTEKFVRVCRIVKTL